MKRILRLVFFMVIVLSEAHGQGVCDTSYWNHTYYNQRLKVYDSCVTISATIKLLDPPLFTGDGDYHIYTTPDSAYTWMVDYRTPAFLKQCLGTDSTLKFAGALNVEEICKGTPTDAGTDGTVEKAACNGFNDTVYLPNIGEHVRIRGTFIYDTVHCWNEIHPVTACAIIKPAGINEIDGAALANGLKVFPQPANNDLRFQFQHAPHAVTLIRLYNLEGQQMFIYALSETNELRLDVSDWPNGQYIYQVVLKDQNQVLKSGKISVAH
jgi:hypothetical protein